MNQGDDEVVFEEPPALARQRKLAAEAQLAEERASRFLAAIERRPGEWALLPGPVLQRLYAEMPKSNLRGTPIQGVVRGLPVEIVQDKEDGVTVIHIRHVPSEPR